MPTCLRNLSITGIALVLGAASLTAFAAVTPGHDGSYGSFSGNATQLATTKKPRFNSLQNNPLDLPPGSSKWIRLCKEGRECSSADDDIKRRSTFKA